jgi:hypothetical protein
MQRRLRETDIEQIELLQRSASRMLREGRAPVDVYEEIATRHPNLKSDIIDEIVKSASRMREGVIGKIGNKIQDIVDPDLFYGKDAPYKDLAHHGPMIGTIRDRINKLLNTDFRSIENSISKGPYFIGTKDPEAIATITKNVQKAQELLRAARDLCASVNDRGSYNPEELDPEGKYARPPRPKWFKESRVREGGPRHYIKKDVKDAFVKEILAIKNPEHRKEEFDKIMDEIKDANVKAFLKSHPETTKAEAETQSPPMGSPGSETI